MLVQIIKLGKESSFNNEDDKLRLEGKVFYAKDKSQIQMIDRKWEGLPDIGYLSDVELIIHKDFKNLFLLDKYSFFDVDFKILRLWNPSPYTENIGR